MGGKREGDIQAKGPACIMMWSVSYDMKDNLSKELLIVQCDWDMGNEVGTSRRIVGDAGRIETHLGRDVVEDLS